MSYFYENKSGRNPLCPHCQKELKFVAPILSSFSFRDAYFFCGLDESIPQYTCYRVSVSDLNRK